MATESEKAIHELEIFARFVAATTFRIDPSTVEKRAPPEPDVLCRTVDGQLVAFELVELCDPNLAKAFANFTAMENAYIRTSDPSGLIIQKKLRRRYKTPHPIELVCYTDGRIGTPADVIIPVAVRQLQASAHNFRKAWFLCRKQVHVLWG